jgi:hypothetical protein
VRENWDKDGPFFSTQHQLLQCKKHKCISKQTFFHRLTHEPSVMHTLASPLWLPTHKTAAQYERQSTLPVDVPTMMLKLPQSYYEVCTLTASGGLQIFCHPAIDEIFFINSSLGRSSVQLE